MCDEEEEEVEDQGEEEHQEEEEEEEVDEDGVIKKVRLKYCNLRFFTAFLIYSYLTFFIMPELQYVLYFSLIELLYSTAKYCGTYFYWILMQISV